MPKTDSIPPILAIIGGIGMMIVAIAAHEPSLALFAGLSAAWAGLALINRRSYFLLEQEFADYVRKHEEVSNGSNQR